MNDKTMYELMFVAWWLNINENHKKSWFFFGFGKCVYYKNLLSYHLHAPVLCGNVHIVTPLRVGKVNKWCYISCMKYKYFIYDFLKNKYCQHYHNDLFRLRSLFLKCVVDFAYTNTTFNGLKYCARIFIFGCVMLFAYYISRCGYLI